MPLLSLLARGHPFDGRITVLAVERRAKCGASPRGGHDPWPVDPRRIVADVLLVPALELRDPVAFLVLVITGDAPVHPIILTAEVVSTPAPRRPRAGFSVGALVRLGVKQRWPFAKNGAQLRVGHCFLGEPAAERVRPVGRGPPSKAAAPPFAAARGAVRLHDRWSRQRRSGRSAPRPRAGGSCALSPGTRS